MIETKLFNFEVVDEFLLPLTSLKKKFQLYWDIIIK